MKTLCILLFSIFCSALSAADKPNILWIFAEDTSPWMGCYDYKVNKGKTPNIDSIASAGVIFKRAFVPAPVCSACRSAMIVGQNQARFGSHEHRSSRGPAKLYLPEGYKTLPEIMRENGYNTFNIGKTDYNFVYDMNKLYNLKLKSKADSFEILKTKQPFFGQIQTGGGKNRTTKFPKNRKTSPSEVTVPADYPDNEIYRTTVAQHYDAIRVDDDLIGKIIANLKKSGLDKNTIVIYFSDHGANNLLRHKQMPTEGGLHVPFMIMGPEKYVPKGQVRNDLINTLDLSASTLAWAGIEKPSWFGGQFLFAKDFKARDHIVSGKDRLDHTIDRVRSVRTDKFRYTRNFKLDRIFLQPQYRDSKNYTKNLHELYQAGKLSPRHKEIYFGERPAEEFYDVSVDPHQMKNLVNDPAYAAELAKHRKLLDDWIAKGDKGAGEESVAALKTNGEGTKWGEGVNVEYEEYRGDKDGDGLSDKWEKLNKRDPADGLLQFEFNCGGWQTEGWKAEGIDSNIAGYLGFLDFTLNNNKGSIFRTGLKVTASDKDKALCISLKSSEGLDIDIYANGKQIASKKVNASDTHQVIKAKLNPAKWNGSINSLKLTFKGKSGADIEVDYIKVER